MAVLRAEASQLKPELKDIRTHWSTWRDAFEERRNASEIHLLRTVSELQAAFQHRVTLLEQNYRELMRQQHGEFETALERNTREVQVRLWADLANARSEFEKLIHSELRVLRQRAMAHSVEPAATVPHLTPPSLEIDWLRFADRFRGSEDYVRSSQQRYLEKFRGSGDVLDLGCGRGEFLSAAKEAGISARGIDLNEECVALCRARGLTADHADLFEYLDELPDASLGGVFCAQVIEHLPPERLPDLVRLVARKLTRGALAIFETPNPECLATFALHFFIDPTHTRPVPPALLVFYLEEAGFTNIEVERSAPVSGLDELPESFRQMFFGGLDFSVTAKKPL
jgi:O-antigen chain-terminating methyltransferase